MDIQLYKTKVSKTWGFMIDERASEKRTLSPADSGSASGSCLGLWDVSVPLWELLGE